MQDPAAAAAAPAVGKTQFAEPEQQLKCPRCDSTNTKFCYYNNYNLSQPRHFCKDCRRYWTRGGALRNIPVGGGTRKNSKRSSSSSSPSSSHSTAAPASKRSSSSSNSSSPTPSADAAAANPSSAPQLPTQFPTPEPISIMYPLVDPDDRTLLDINGSFSSLLASNGNFVNLLDSFNPNEPGAMGAPTSTDLNRSVGDSVFGLQISSGDSNGNENSASECLWPGGWPDLAIYTPGSGFQ